MSSMILIGYDLGASSYRAVVGEILESEKRVRILESMRWPNKMIRLGRSLYWDIIEIWDNVKKSIKHFYKKYGDKIYSIGVDSWGVDFALIDSKGDLIELPHAYRDPRTENIMERVFEKISRERIYELTGIQFMRINTIYHLYSMVLNRDPKLSIASRFLMIPDLIHYWLSGETYVEYTNATTTQLLDARSRVWSREILRALEIPEHIFPEIIYPGTVVGGLKRDLAEELMISRDISVITPAAHDTASAVAAGPMISEDTAYISSGTWSLVGVELSEPLLSREALKYNFTNEGGVFNTIRFLKNVQGMWIVEEIRRILAEERGLELSYEDINRRVLETGLTEVYIDPDYEEFISPDNMIRAVERYLRKTGQRTELSLGELFRVVYQSLALKYRVVIELLERVARRRVRAINVFGGASRNDTLNQLIADLSGRTVYAGPDEATSLGNILTQAIGLGLVRSSSELREYVRNSIEIKRFQPSENTDRDYHLDRFIRVTGLSL
ncbi:MAG: rhamnulokinase family protein [Sulfolobales archaeon]